MGPAEPKSQTLEDILASIDLCDKGRVQKGKILSVLVRPFRAKVLCMDLRSTYLAFAMFGATLLGWRSFYGAGEFPSAGIACLLLLAVLSLIGGYRIAVQRRRALLSAAIEPGSPVAGVLTGRMGASFAAIAGTLATLPITAYFALTASDQEIYLAAATAVWIIVVSLVIERLFWSHLRPRYRMSVVGPAALGIAALPMLVLVMAFSFWVLPVPAYAQTPVLAEALSSALEGLPRHHPLAFEVLSVLRIADAFIYWFLAQDGFRAGLPVFLFLVKGAVIYLSIAKLAFDCRAAMMRSEEKA